MISAKIINVLKTYRLAFRAWVSTKYMYLFCRLYGVEMGKGCRFWKKTIFYKHVKARITIGSHCLFRSDLYSNLIGINRKCIISTHTPTSIITIGDNCAFSGTSIGAKESIEIGNNVQVGANSVITDFDWHSLDSADRNNTQNIKSQKVVIEDNVWIGADCIILKGVHIGKNAVIGAGSIVVSDIPENSICAGNPCKFLKQLN